MVKRNVGQRKVRIVCPEWRLVPTGIGTKWAKVASSTDQLPHKLRLCGAPPATESSAYKGMRFREEIVWSTLLRRKTTYAIMP
jgi:hypothetical protein